MSTIRVSAEATVVVPDGEVPTPEQLLAAIAQGGLVTHVEQVDDPAIITLQQQVAIGVGNKVDTPVPLPSEADAAVIVA